MSVCPSLSFTLAPRLRIYKKNNKIISESHLLFHIGTFPVNLFKVHILDIGAEMYVYKNDNIDITMMLFLYLYKIYSSDIAIHNSQKNILK